VQVTTVTVSDPFRKEIFSGISKERTFSSVQIN
jgi:hypothetical protein